MAIRELSEFIDIQLLKNDGTVNILGTLEFFENLTLNPVSVYAEPTLVTDLGSTVALDAAGRWLSSEIWLPVAVRIRCRDSVGNLLWTKDNVNIEISGTSATEGGNLINNGSFETDTNADGIPDGWSLVAHTGSTNTIDNTTQSEGAKSLKSTSTGNGGGTWLHDAYIEIDEKARYVADYDLKSSVAAANDVRIIVEILWYDSAKTQLGGGSSSTTLYDIDSNNPGSFAHFQNDIAPPAGARYGRPRVRLCDSSDLTSGSAWIDAFSLMKQPGTLNLPGNFAVAGSMTAGGTIAETADISPAQITADQNDYNPTGLSTAAILRINSDAARSITGQAGGSDGRRLTYLNIGSFTVTLTNEDAASAAANRFAIGSYLAIPPNSGIQMIYDATSSRWRVYGANALPVNVQSFTTPGGGTWTKPANYPGNSRVHVQLWAGGGSGGRGNGATGGGGGGGGYVEGWFLLSELGATEATSVGAGGASRTSGATNGASGGNTTFGSWLTAYGGGGGNGANALPGGGGGGGALSAGVVGGNGPGGIGGNPDPGAAGIAATSDGGDSSFGGGGGGPESNATIENGGRSYFGGGGGGGGDNSSGQGGDGGSSFYGGGGGAGGNATGGTSVRGGAGGTGGIGGTNGTAGAQPGGGGGGTVTGNSGAGGDGKIIVTIYP